jgi:integrase
VDQCKKILEGTKWADRAYAVLGMMAGIRPEEIRRMNWRDVDLQNAKVRLRPEITKTNVGRIIPLEPNAVAWLKTVAQSSGPIFDGDASCLTIRFRTAAGMKTWSLNALRHTFGTMHTTHFEDAGKTAMALHSTENPKVLFRHYFRSVLKEDAAKFWVLMP